MIKSIAVYCGSASGSLPVYAQMAQQAGKYLAEQKIRVIYGGASIGMMGALANSAIAHGGEVVGIIPSFISAREIAHHGLTELVVVDNMHQRKQKMSDLCDAVLALPGGFGTLDELFEMLTWAQLGLHAKPIGALNISGYFDHLKAFVNNAVEAGFVQNGHKDILLTDNSIEALLAKMQQHTARGLQTYEIKQIEQ